MLKKLSEMYSKRARENRGSVFRDYLNPTENDKILDLGSGDGSHIASIIPFRENVYIADISHRSLERGKERFGFKTILLDETGFVPFPDMYFDIVLSSSVIEHVTVDKRDVKRFRSNVEFTREAQTRQSRFAKELRRIAKRYFVQTPNRYFPIESHTWLPAIIILLPRTVQIRMIDFFNKWWPKKTIPDWNLLTKTQMQQLFPDAEIVLEKSCGFTKSIMAIRKSISAQE